MRQRGEREVVSEFASLFHNEGLPHEATRGVVREGEVDCLVKELLELLLVALSRLAGAANDRDAGLVGNPLGLPLEDRLLDARGLAHIVFLRLLLTLLLFLLRRPYFLRLIDVNDRRFKLLGHHEHHGDHLVGFGFTRSEVAVDVLRAHVEDH